MSVFRISMIDVSSTGSVCSGPGGMVGRTSSSYIHSSEAFRLATRDSAVRAAAIEINRRIARNVAVTASYHQKDKLALTLLNAFPTYIAYASRSARDDYTHSTSDTQREAFSRAWATNVLRLLEAEMRVKQKKDGMLPTDSQRASAAMILQMVAKLMTQPKCRLSDEVRAKIRLEASNFNL